MTASERQPTSAPSAAHQWWTLQVFYHQADKDHLIVHGATPVLERLQAQHHIERSFLQRHWHHGPHLRINVLLSPEAAADEVRQALVNGLQPYLQAHPSVTQLDEAEYIRRYAPVAGYELLDQPLLPLYGSGELRWSPLLMRDHRYGSPRIAHLSRELLSDLQPMVTTLLASRPTAEGRLLQFAGWMFTFAGAFQECMDDMFGSVPSVALSFRSHAEGYYHNVPEGDTVRCRFEQTARVNRAALARELELALDTAGPYTILRTHLARAAAQGLTLHARNELYVFGRKDYEIADQQLAPGIPRPTGSYSPRHATLADPDSDLSRLLQEPEIQIRRWLVNLLYDRMMTAGCRPVERFALCELVASTVEAVHGPDSFLYPAPRPLKVTAV